MTRVLIWKGQEIPCPAWPSRPDEQDGTCMSHLPRTCWDGATFPVTRKLAAKELDGRVWDGSANFAVMYCGLWHPPVAVLPPVLYPVGLLDAVAALV